MLELFLILNFFKQNLNSFHADFSCEANAYENIFIRLGQEFFKNLLVRILVVPLASGSLRSFIEHILKFFKSIILLAVRGGVLAEGASENLLPAVFLFVGRKTRHVCFISFPWRLNFATAQSWFSWGWFNQWSLIHQFVFKSLDLFCTEIVTKAVLVFHLRLFLVEIRFDNPLGLNFLFLWKRVVLVGFVEGFYLVIVFRLSEACHQEHCFHLLS